MPKNKLFLLTGFLISAIALVYFIGFNKIKKDISRIIHNSSPKPPQEVYQLLFKKPADSCSVFINFKDQVIPKIDCCIWMELKLCPAELRRIISLKKYEATKFSKYDSSKFLNGLNERPQWWRPQTLGDSLIKMDFKFNTDNEQVLFFGKDSLRVYVCDKAL